MKFQFQGVKKNVPRNLYTSADESLLERVARWTLTENIAGTTESNENAQGSLAKSQDNNATKSSKAKSLPCQSFRAAFQRSMSSYSPSRKASRAFLDSHSVQCYSQYSECRVPLVNSTIPPTWHWCNLQSNRCQRGVGKTHPPASGSRDLHARGTTEPLPREHSNKCRNRERKQKARQTLETF